MSGEQNYKKIVSEIEKSGKAIYYTKGFSMLPMLKEGRDMSVLVPINRELKRGDVVLFVRENKGNQLVLHRIIRPIGDNGFIIRGDNTYLDEPVKKEDIKAVLSGFFRKGKYIDCEKSRGYRFYSFLQLRLYFLRKFFLKTIRVLLAKIKNNVFHLNSLHLNDILGIKRD